MASHPAAFMSYAHFNDDRDAGYLTDLQGELSTEVEALTGQPFEIFQDRRDIRWGQQWQARIDESIDATTFLFPIVTPHYFESQACRDEFERFLVREQQLERNNLILPIYYIDSPALHNDSDIVARELSSRQWWDWRQLRRTPLKRKRVQTEINKLASEIKDALARVHPAGGAAPSGPSLQTFRVEDEFAQPDSDVFSGPQPDFGPPFDVSRLVRVPHFVGRKAQVDWLIGRLLDSKNRLAAISGMPGIGKSSLALATATRLHELGEFPDGIAAVQCEDAADPVEILSEVFSRFDPGRRSPTPGEEQRVHEVARHLLNGKRGLVILDGVQPGSNIFAIVQTLLGAGLALLITSQALMPYDVVPPDSRLVLNPLSQEEAMDLFAYAMGKSSVGNLGTSEVTSATEITANLEGHPLAIELLVAYIADLGLDPSAAVKQLRQPARTLSVPRGETSSVLKVAFTKSFEAIPTDAQRVFTALALFSSLDCGREAVLALAEAVAVDRSEESVNALVLRSLVRGQVNDTMPEGSDRQRIRTHPLLHAFAEGQLSAWSSQERDTVFGAAAEHYIHYLSRVFGAVRARLETETQLDFASQVRLAIAPDADNIGRVIEWAVSNDHNDDEQKKRDGILFSLCTFMQDYWSYSGLNAILLKYAPVGLEAAQRLLETETENVSELRMAASRLAVAYGKGLIEIGKVEEAEDILKGQIPVRRDLGDDRGLSAVLYQLSRVVNLRGDMDMTISGLQESLRLITAIDSPDDEVYVLNELARYETIRCHFADAARYLGRSAQLGSRISLSNRARTKYLAARLAFSEDRLDEAERGLQELLNQEPESSHMNRALVLCWLGQIERRRGNLDKAEKYTLEGLDVAEDRKYQQSTAIILHSLAQVALERHQWDKAEEYGRKSMALFRELHDEPNYGMQLSTLGAAAVGREQWDLAESYLQEALVIEKKSQNVHQQGAILMYLGLVARRRNQLAEAVSFYSQSLAPLEQSRERDIAEVVRKVLEDLGQARRNQRR